MPGCTKLSPETIESIIDFFSSSKGKYQKRDKCLFLIGISTGFRVSEILSLRIESVCVNYKGKISIPLTILDSIKVERKNLKGGSSENTTIESRTVRINDTCKKALYEYISDWRNIYIKNPEASSPLFMSRKMEKKTIASSNPLNMDRVEKIQKSISRDEAAHILDKAFVACGVKKVANGSVATHSMRKTYAHNMYHLLGDNIVKLQKAMGHKNLNNTIRYLAIEEEEINDKSGMLLNFLEKKEETMIEQLLPTELPNWE